MIASIILICCALLGLIVSIVKHGENKGEYNAYVEFFAFIILMVLYYYSGVLRQFAEIFN